MKQMVTKLKKRFLPSTLLALLIVGLSAGVFAQAVDGTMIYLPAMASPSKSEENSTDQSPAVQESDDPYEQAKQRAIDLLTTQEIVAEFLSGYPDWEADGWPDEGDADIWYLDLFSANRDEWIGNGQVNIATDEIVTYFVPRELSPEEFQTGMQKVEATQKRDPELQAMLGDPELWGHETSYNPWEQRWETYYWYGVDGVTVYCNINEDDHVYIASIRDTHELAEEEKAAQARNQAIEVAFTAPGIDQALNEVYDWRTYIEEQGDSRYSVEFVVDGQELFYALVDIERWTVIESGQ